MLRALARSKRPPEGRVPRACVAARVAIQVLRIARYWENGRQSVVQFFALLASQLLHTADSPYLDSGFDRAGMSSILSSLVLCDFASMSRNEHRQISLLTTVHGDRQWYRLLSSAALRILSSVHIQHTPVHVRLASLS